MSQVKLLTSYHKVSLAVHFIGTSCPFHWGVCSLEMPFMLHCAPTSPFFYFFFSGYYTAVCLCWRILSAGPVRLGWFTESTFSRRTQSLGGFLVKIAQGCIVTWSMVGLHTLCCRLYLLCLCFKVQLLMVPWVGNIWVWFEEFDSKIRFLSSNKSICGVRVGCLQPLKCWK